MSDFFRTIFTSFLFIILLFDVVYPSNFLMLSIISITIFSYLNLRSIELNTNYNKYFIIFLFLFLIVSLFHFQTLYRFTFSIEQINNYNFNLFLSLLTFLFLPFLYKKRKIIFEKSIDISLYLIVSFFFLQILVYYITGYYIDVLEDLRGEASRFNTYSSLKIALDALGFDFIRPTSIFNEPGTYASFTTILFMISWIKHRRILKIHILFFISLFLSFSTFGVVLALLICVVLYIQYIKNSIFFSVKNFVFVIPILILIFSLGNLYYEARFLSDVSQSHGGLLIRKVTFESFLSNIIDNKVFGLSPGFNNLDKFFIEDSTLLFSVVLYYGLYAILIIYTIYKFFKKHMLPLLFVFIISLSKMPFDSFAFWFFIVGLNLVYFGNLDKTNYEA